MSRPRSIPEKEAIERALGVFWEKGYDRTSIADLSEAIGVGPSSIYNAFGSKLELFEKSINQYMSTHIDFADDLVAKSESMTASESMGEFLASVVALCTDKSTPRGCAMMQAGGSGVASNSQACAVTHMMKTGVESTLLDFFKAKHAGGEKLSAEPKVLAKFILGTARGISQLACDGSSRRELLAVADHAARSCSESH
jgi:AcrR family transcriptional regulator